MKLKRRKEMSNNIEKREDVALHEQCNLIASRFDTYYLKWLEIFTISALFINMSLYVYSKGL